MISHPRPGQAVQVWYRAAVARTAPWHGRTGRVVVGARGPGPRNHGVELDGRLVVVPCGNLRRVAE